MSDQKPKYSKPILVDLQAGDLQQASALCYTGNSDTGTCWIGHNAFSGCYTGNFARTGCANGPQAGNFCWNGGNIT